MVSPTTHQSIWPSTEPDFVWWFNSAGKLCVVRQFGTRKRRLVTASSMFSADHLFRSSQMMHWLGAQHSAQRACPTGGDGSHRITPPINCLSSSHGYPKVGVYSCPLPCLYRPLPTRALTNRSHLRRRKVLYLPRHMVSDPHRICRSFILLMDNRIGVMPQKYLNDRKSLGAFTPD